MSLCLTDRINAAQPEHEAATRAGSHGKGGKGSLVARFHPVLGKEAGDLSEDMSEDLELDYRYS